MRSARRIIAVLLLVQVAWMTVAAFVSGHPGLRLGFGAGALAVLAILLVFVLVWQRGNARRERLLRVGVRAPAVLVSSRPTNVVINNRRVQAHTFESRDGVRAVARAFVHLPVGTEGTVVYDPHDRRQAVVLEDLDALPRRSL